MWCAPVPPAWEKLRKTLEIRFELFPIQDNEAFFVSAAISLTMSGNGSRGMKSTEMLLSLCSLPFLEKHSPTESLA